MCLRLDVARGRALSIGALNCLGHHLFKGNLRVLLRIPPTKLLIMSLKGSRKGGGEAFGTSEEGVGREWRQGSSIVDDEALLALSLFCPLFCHDSRHHCLCQDIA